MDYPSKKQPIGKNHCKEDSIHILLKIIFSKPTLKEKPHMKETMSKILKGIEQEF
jgi:hypothetical protein